MKVLMTADAMGGVWTYALHLARGLRVHGIEVTLAVMGTLTEQQKVEVDVAIHHAPFRLEWMDACWDDVREAGDWLLHLESISNPDLVHINGYVHAALPWRVPAVVVAHSCVLSWWIAVHNEPAPDTWNEYRRQVKRGLQHAAMVIAPSHAMLRALCSEHGDCSKVKKVIYNGVNGEQDIETQRRQIIFAAGRVWDKGKNLMLLDRIAGRVASPVYVAGNQDSTSALNAVNCLGRLTQPDLKQWMRQSAIFASPALYEPFGLTVLEAALAGCALVLSDLPSFREIWGDAALFVDPRDEDNWTTQLNELAGDADRIRLLASGAQARAREYTAERMSSSYAEAYREAVH